MADECANIAQAKQQPQDIGLSGPAGVVRTCINGIHSTSVDQLCITLNIYEDSTMK